MKNWQEELRDLASKVEHAIDKGRLNVKKEFNLLDDIIILPYRSYGNQEQFYLHGRVLENEGLDTPPEDATLWDNLSTLYHRYESDEIPEAPVQYEIDSLKGTVTTDQEGYYKCQLEHKGAKKSGWHKVKLRLLKQYKEDQSPVEVSGEVLFPSTDSSFGIISDLDDTVIVSQATNFLEKSKILLLNNERTRKPFEGVAAFYNALCAGKDKQRNNPMFYVSSSSWNLYDMFKNFCDYNDLPKGVFLLRDVGLDKQKFYRTGHGKHKLEKISRVLDTFKDLSFLLIGDSGQHDPEIYQQIVKQYPGRIMGIYIRDVDPKENKPRDREVKEIAEQVEKEGVPMLLVKNSLEAAKHAVSQGWIPADTLEKIEQDVRHDESEKQDVRKTLGLHKLFG